MAVSRKRSVVVALAVVLLGVAAALAQETGQYDSFFHLEWTVGAGSRGATLTGYVHNRYGFSADRMLLSVERLDGAGQVVERRLVWVAGGVPAGGRAYFSARVADPAATYRVRISGFDWIGRGGGG